MSAAGKAIFFPLVFSDAATFKTQQQQQVLQTIIRITYCDDIWQLFLLWDIFFEGDVGRKKVAETLAAATLNGSDAKRGRFFCIDALS